MAHPDPVVRSLYASAAALIRHARSSDPRETTAAARAAFAEKFVVAADPDANLPADERLRRADLLRRAHFKKLAAKSVAARRKR